MKSYVIWNISIIPPVEYVHPLGLLTSNLHSLKDQKLLLESEKKAWNTKSFVNMMKPRFYMAITCFATQSVSINLLKKRTLFTKTI